MQTKVTKSALILLVGNYGIKLSHYIEEYYELFLIVCNVPS